jgi:hypothetical protein
MNQIICKWLFVILWDFGTSTIFMQKVRGLTHFVKIARLYKIQIENIFLSL